MRQIEEKALKLVLEHRVSVLWVGQDAASGIVDGFHETYRCSYSPADKVCTCPAGQNHRVCSHVIALELAVLAQKERVEV